MPAAAPSGGSQDNSAAILWMTAAFIVALGAIWFTFHNQIISFYFMIKLYELRFLGAINPYIGYHLGDLGDVYLKIATLYSNPTTTSFNDLFTWGSKVGTLFRIPVAIFLTLLGAIVYFTNTARVFKRTYSMRDLAKLEKDNWPQITPVINLDLIKTDIDTGPWAMAMTPVQFCKRYRLLEEIRPQRQEGMTRKDYQRIDVVLKRGEANKLFALQLGPLWKGTNNLPPYTRALFAAFAARINADSAAAQKLLLQLSGSSNASKLNTSGVDDLLKKHENTKLVQQVMNSHAYVSTVMASMLQAAREDGVQASADFLWLKPVDRKLWYTLNTVGRQTPFIEVAGIFAHWVAEKDAGRKLQVPMVEEATNAVELALKEVVYRPDEK